MAVAGDIAFVGLINGAANNDTTSSAFAFITFNGLPQNGTLVFADNLPGNSTGGESVLTITLNQAVLPNAIVIVQLNPGGGGATVYVSDTAGSTTAVGTGVVTGPGALQFGGNDQLFAFNGSGFGAANVIAAVDFSGNALSASIPAGAITLDFAGGTVGNNEGFVFNGASATPANLSNPANFLTDQTPSQLGIAELASVVCFMPGTMISTPLGSREIESLTAGDLVTTHDGPDAPVRWVGRQTVSRLFADPLRVLPIRIRAGALGDNLPARDLLVSPDHALMLEGVLVQAGALVNGSSITRERDVPAVFTYYHVELANHALLLAEGVPAETFIDNVDRMRFDNWHDHAAAQGDAPIAEMELPRAKSARQVPASVRRVIAERARAVAA